jgi:hypothetical protein
MDRKLAFRAAIDLIDGFMVRALEQRNMETAYKAFHLGSLMFEAFEKLNAKSS